MQQPIQLAPNTIAYQYGNPHAESLIICSHGFGTDHTDRGLFVDLTNQFTESHRIIMIDYNQYQSSHTAVPPYSQQADHFSQVYNALRPIYGSQRVFILAHSSGCITAALAAPQGTYILLSPPLHSPYADFKKHFAQNPNHHIDESSTSILIRSDGSSTQIGADFWQQVKSVQPETEYLRLVQSNKVHLIRPLNDEVITDSDYHRIQASSIQYHPIPGNHNFDPPHRQQLIRLVSSIISSQEFE